MDKRDEELNKRIKKSNEIVTHYVLTIFFSAITAIIFTLLLR